MQLTKMLVSGGSAAALVLALLTPAFAQSTTPQTSPNAQQPVRYENCTSGTANENAGTPNTGTTPGGSTQGNASSSQPSNQSDNASNDTSTSAGGGTTSPTSNSGVDTSVSGNSGTQPNQPCAHQQYKHAKGTAPNGAMTPTTPANQAMPATTAPTSNMDALSNNPNGSNWLDKFNRPVTANMTAHMRTHRMHRVKRASGGGGGGM